MLEALKQQVFEANLLLPRHNLVVFTWGNVSGIDRKRGLVVIKPSGVDYEVMTVDDMVVVDITTGETVGSRLKPSSDTPSHLELYRRFPGIGGVTHTHSRWATLFSQSGRDLPPLGTTHADHFRGAVPVTRPLTDEEIGGDYELNTGRVIVERFAELDADAIPAVLVASHGPFTWGKTALDSAKNAVVLEELSFMAWHNLSLDPTIKSVSEALLDRHYLRKHGAGAYYGQSAQTPQE